jgi:hypothetical protein
MTDAVIEHRAATVAGDGRLNLLRPVAFLVAAQLSVGILIGVAWRLWAPATVSYLLPSGGGGSFVIPDESEAQVAVDGRFVVLTVAAGLLFGVLAWWLRSLRGPVALGALAIGGLLSSVAARLVGGVLAQGSPATHVNSVFAPGLSLHASAALWLQAFFAVLGYAAIVGLSAEPNLGLAPAHRVTGEDGPNGADGQHDPNGEHGEDGEHGAAGGDDTEILSGEPRELRAGKEAGGLS